MAQHRTYEYHEWNKTSGNPKILQISSETDPPEPPVDVQSNLNNKTDVESNSGISTNSLQKPEIPVVEMRDFEVVDMNDKLNLLMSAINKINTNFHYKIESVKSQILADIAPQTTAVEKRCEELEARMEVTKHWLQKLHQ